MLSSDLSKRTISTILLTLLISSMLISCGGEAPDAPTSEAPPTPIPTEVPPPAAARAVLAASPETSPSDLAEAQAVVAGLAAGSGLEFEVRQEIFANEITPDVKIIVFLEQPGNLGSLAANAPNTQFVAISTQNWSPPANGTIILKDETHIAFLSGYLSAMLAPNFRVGGLLIAEDAVYNQAFINGVSYFCGLCASVVYPLNRYPFISQQPANSPPANWQAAFNEINANKINVLFLPGGAASPEFGAYLSGIDVAVIGDQTPPDELRPRWVATISSDGLTPLTEIWNDLLNGQGGKVLNASVKISEINYISLNDGLVWLSRGKMDLLDKVKKLLRDGQIYTGSVN